MIFTIEIFKMAATLFVGWGEAIAPQPPSHPAPRLRINRELKIRRRRRHRERKKRKRFRLAKQRASRVFVHFFAVVARQQRASS